MTNAITLTLVLLILGLFVLDATVLHLGLPLLAAKGTAELIEWVSFWR